MIIQLDFDGTVVEHQYPKIGRENFGCMEVIKKLQDAGHEIILNTYRSDVNNGTLEKALDFLNLHPKVDLKPIKRYNPQKIHPQPFDWRKMMETKTIWIDDISMGIPLKESQFGHGIMVDWDRLNLEFEANGIY